MLSKNIKDLKTEELISQIEYHNKKYWEDACAEISDEEYDALVRELAYRISDHQLLEKIYSPKIPDNAQTVQHTKPMLSLDKVYSHEELIKWAAKFARSEDEMFLVQPKYDGISASLSNGILATRGDGFQGEDISDKLPLIELETKNYKGKPIFDARGEIVIRNDDFKNIYSKILKKDNCPYKNQRNAVSGIIGLKDISEMKSQGAKLTLVDYDTHTKTISLANLKKRSAWEQIVEEFSALPYPMDGIVLKLKDSSYSESLGSTAHHPRGQIAFKFSGARATSVIKNIEWSFGKKNLTPLAIIEPVQIGGITIKKLTLHNYSFLKENDIQIGDKIIVERAGDVIPHIVSSEPCENRKSPEIEFCPSCSSKLIIEGPELVCPNTNCPEIQTQRLLAAIKNIGIECLGESTLRKMIATLGVKHLKDVFSLSEGDISKLEGFKSKSSEKLYNEIQSAKNTTDFALIAALNIQGIGKNIAKSILEKFTLEELRKMTPIELEQIQGIGPERANELFNKLKEESDTIDELLSALNVSQTKNRKTQNKKTICFTGKMPMPRSHYENLAKDNGFEPCDSVTSSLSILVAANPSEKSSKLEKAQKLSIKIITLDDWLKNINTDSKKQEDTQHQRQDDELRLGI